MKLKDCFPGDYYVIDTETSGLKPQTNRILEIAVMSIKDRKPVDLPSSWLLNPSYPDRTFAVPDEITKITGITTEDVTDGKNPLKILKHIRQKVGEVQIYAHNGIRFDRPFINAEFDRVGIPQFRDEMYLDSAAIFKAWRIDILDWLDNRTFFEFANRVLEKRAYGVYFNLKFCCEILNIDVTDLKAHRADADVIMTYRVIEALRKRLLKDDL